MSHQQRMQATDIYTEMLQQLQVSCSLFARCELQSPWGMALPQMSRAYFHVVLTGDCLLQLGEETEPLALAGGDCVILPHGTEHALVSAETSHPLPLPELMAYKGPAPLGPIRYGGAEGSVQTTLICGDIGVDGESLHPLLSVLPTYLYVAGEDGKPAKWLDATLQLLAIETSESRLGSNALLTRLADVFYMQVLRTYLDTLKEEQSWLQGQLDPQLGPVLQKMHQEPGRDWSITALAREARMSRSAFCARFQQNIGEAPMQYLTRWRMFKAARQLRQQRDSLFDIAMDVGYQSESAFSKAFKRWVGCSPGMYRRTHA